MADPNALSGVSTDDGTLMPEGRRKLRTVGGSMLDVPNNTNALAAISGAPPDSGESVNALNPGVMTPFPPDLAARLGDYLADNLMPTRRSLADGLGAPGDAAAYLLHRIAGLDVPTPTPSNSTHTYQPAASVPFSSEFFNNLLGDAGDVSAEAWRRLRR